MILELVTYPNDVLQRGALGQPLLSTEEIESKEIQDLIDNMIETANSLGALGLAAPQVGVDKPIAIFRTPKDAEFKVMINPHIKKIGSKVYSYGEGCLSSPEKRYRIKRHKKVIVEYDDREGRPQKVASRTKMEAFVLQHEIDHLRGVTLAEFAQEE